MTKKNDGTMTQLIIKVNIRVLRFRALSILFLKKSSYCSSQLRQWKHTLRLYTYSTTSTTNLSRMAGRIITLLVTVAALSANAFMIPAFRSKYISTSSLRMSDAPVDPMEAIRARMAQDPSYEPLKDPATMQQLESMIPSEYREFANAMERLKVAFADAQGGVDGLEDLDSLAAIAINTKVGELLSSPQSKFFQGGAADEEIPFDEEKLRDLLADVQRDFPDVPMSQ